MNSTQKTRSIILFENYVHSPKTRELYSTLINMFLKFHDISSWDSVLQMEKTSLKEKIEDYLIHLKNQNKSPSHMRNITFAIQSFLESNDFEGINWKKIRKLIGKHGKSRNSRPYTTEEIKRMLDVSKSLRNRALILFLSSSGVRRGAIPNMRIKDLKQMQLGCLAVTVYPNEHEEYVTFINKESSEALTAYHERRKKQGEILTPESLVFPSANSYRKSLAVTDASISFLIRRIKIAAADILDIISEVTPEIYRAKDLDKKEIVNEDFFVKYDYYFELSQKIGDTKNLYSMILPLDFKNKHAQNLIDIVKPQFNDAQQIRDTESDPLIDAISFHINGESTTASYIVEEDFKRLQKLDDKLIAMSSNIEKAQYLEMEVQKYDNIPGWTNNIIEWYISDELTEKELAQAMKYLNP